MSTGRGAYGMHQDPFNDPFFANPFSMMNQMMGQMNQMMNSMFAADPFFAGGGPHQQQHQQASRQRLPSTVIEEVHDDRPVTGSSSQPIVEEPDGELWANEGCRVCVGRMEQGGPHSRFGALPCFAAQTTRCTRMRAGSSRQQATLGTATSRSRSACLACSAILAALAVALCMPTAAAPS